MDHDGMEMEYREYFCVKDSMAHDSNKSHWNTLETNKQKWCVILLISS